MPYRNLDEILLDAVALAFPLGGVSELARKLSASYRQSFELFNGDPRICDKDVKTLVGHFRRALINKDLVTFAEQYPNAVSCFEKMEGIEGCNNHVELRIGDFLVTHHHHTKSDAMPEDFINLSSNYNAINADVNEYFEPAWFVENGQAMEARPHFLNLLILHEKSSDGLAEIGRIEFVFSKKSKKFVTIEVSKLARRQTEIMDLDSEDLFDFKRRSASEIRRFIA